MSRFFFSAGEASGDACAARLLIGLRAKNSSTEAVGVGGTQFLQAGGRLVANSGDWGAVSITESVKKIPSGIVGFRKAIAELRRGSPGVFVPIDYGYFNIRLARQARQAGWKVVYFNPPGSWRRNRQGKHIPVVSDKVITPFEWSRDLLNQMGAEAYWFGHPLKQMIGEIPPTHSARDAIALLPGSRLHEIDNNLPAMAAAVKGIERPLIFGLAPAVDPENFQRQWASLGGPNATVIQGSVPALLQSRVAIVCSGTATLEAAICSCPMVVMYRGSKVMELEFRLLRPKLDRISLPNILLQQDLVPEFIQWDATPERLRNELDALLSDGPAKQAQIEGFKRLDVLLGSDTAMDQSVDLLLDFASIT